MPPTSWARPSTSAAPGPSAAPGLSSGTPAARGWWLRTWFRAIPSCPFDGGSGWEFGTSVDLSVARIAIGARRVQGDTTTSRIGAVHVYERDASGNGSQASKLEAADFQNNDEACTEVSIDGDLVAAGSPLDDDNGSTSGSGDLFLGDPSGAWCQIASCCPATESAPTTPATPWRSLRGSLSWLSPSTTTWVPAAARPTCSRSSPTDPGSRPRNCCIPSARATTASSSTWRSTPGRSPSEPSSTRSASSPARAPRTCSYPRPTRAGPRPRSSSWINSPTRTSSPGPWASPTEPSTWAPRAATCKAATRGTRSSTTRSTG
jgi:hypothetical protein